MRSTIKPFVPAISVLVVATAALADKTWKEIPNEDEIVFDERFTLDGDPRLVVDLEDLDVTVVHGESGAARVQVEVKARDRDRAMEYFEDLRFRAGADDGELTVETRRPRLRINFGWDHTRRVNARAVITIPRDTDMEITTSDGDLEGGDIEGAFDSRTGDGDVKFVSIKGRRVRIKASDGDVQVDRIESDEIRVSTSDGDLILGELEGETVTLKTSDGDVRVDGIDAEDVSVRSSDGDVTIDAASGKVAARTSDGDITVGIGRSLELELTTSDGDVYLNASGKLAASLDLRGDHVRIHGRHDFDGDMSKRRVKGKIGGGGPLIMARTSDGDVSLHLR